MSELMNIVKDACNNNVSVLYGIGPIQQPYNFYLLNNSSYNFVFECTTLDVSAKMPVAPAFVNYFDVSGVGFSTVNETATLTVFPDDLNNLFVFQPRITTGTTPTPVTVQNMNEMIYSVNVANFKFNYSAAIVTKLLNNGTVTNIVPNATRIEEISLANDYINSLAETITGSYSIQQSLFQNTTQLINGVKSLDSKFNFAFNRDVSSNKDPSLNDVIPTLNSINPITNAYARCAQQLIDGLLSFTTDERIIQFLSDISGQTQMPYKFIFHPGDTVAIRIGYAPNMKVVGLDSTKFTTRFYKIFLKVI
jgi:hypothetical protein